MIDGIVLALALLLPGGLIALAAYKMYKRRQKPKLELVLTNLDDSMVQAEEALEEVIQEAKKQIKKKKSAKKRKGKKNARKN